MRKLLYILMIMGLNPPYVLDSAAVSGPSGKAKIATALTQATFVARVLTQQFAIAHYYFVISTHFN